MSRRRILVALAWAALGQPLAAAAQQVPEEAPVVVRLPRLPDTLLTALYADSTIYLPVGGLFRWLLVDTHFDVPARRLSGTYLRPSRPYVLDARAGTAVVAGRQLRFAPTDLVANDEDIFLPPRLLQELFGLRADFDLPTLSVTLSSPDTFPVILGQTRALERQRRFRVDRPPPAPPLRFDRQRHWLDGLMVQYDATTTGGSAGPASFRSNTIVGGEVLGGDVQGNLELDRSGSTTRASFSDASWHFVVNSPQRLLTEIGVGSLPSVGLEGRPIHGLQITNEPVQPRLTFADQAVVGMTQPNWEVELYVGDRLVGFTRADPTGRYQFDVPLTYGSSLLSIRAFGPTGGEQVEQRRAEVPFSLLPSGALDYNLTGGRDISSGVSLADARVQYGLREGLTALAGMDYVRTPGSTPVAYGGATARILSNVISSALVAPNAFSRASLGLVAASQARLQLDYTGYATDTLYNQLRMQKQLELQASLPVRYRGATATFFTSSGFVRYLAGSSGLDINAQALFSMGALKPSFALRRSILTLPQGRLTLANQATTGILYFIDHPPVLLRALRGSLVSAATDFALPDRRLAGVHAGLARNLTRAGRLSVSCDWAASTRTGQLQLRYDLNLASMQASSAVAQATTGDFAVAQSVRGTAGLDPDDRSWLFTSRLGVGRSAVAFRMFLDANGNGRYDPGEEAIGGAQIRLQQSASMRVEGDGTIRVSDLLPYYRYDAEVDESGIANPLWRPAYSHFGFVTDPNAFKRVDVPFYAAGELAGTVVVQQPEGKPRELGGLTVVVQRIDEPGHYAMVTFGDGTFYYPGLPPGTYALAPDPEQLKALRMSATPAARTLTIPRTADGVTLSGLDFTLTPLPSDLRAAPAR